MNFEGLFEVWEHQDNFLVSAAGALAFGDPSSLNKKAPGDRSRLRCWPLLSVSCLSDVPLRIILAVFPKITRIKSHLFPFFETSIS